jgi:hypothetical protein
MAAAPYQSVLERFPDHAKAIGMTSIEIANLDIFLGYLFAAILRIHSAAGEAIYLTPKSAFARLDLLEVAIREMIEDHTPGRKNLRSIHSRAAKIVTERHAMIHDSWGTNAEGAVARRAIRGQSEMTGVPLKQLEQAVHDIRVLIGDVRAATSKLEHDASPAIPN